MVGKVRAAARQVLDQLAGRAGLEFRALDGADGVGGALGERPQIGVCGGFDVAGVAVS